MALAHPLCLLGQGAEDGEICVHAGIGKSNALDYFAGGWRSEEDDRRVDALGAQADDVIEARIAQCLDATSEHRPSNTRQTAYALGDSHNLHPILTTDLDRFPCNCVQSIPKTGGNRSRGQAAASTISAGA